MEPSDLSNDSSRDYAWNYFQIHASQRLTTFNFYIVISSAIATALFASFQQSYKFPYFGIFLGCLLILFAFVFWKLDGRNKFLIKQAEAALKYFEAQLQSTSSAEAAEPHVAQIFLREEYTTGIVRTRNSSLFWKRHFSYSECFNLVFLTFGMTGLLSAIVLILFRL